MKMNETISYDSAFPVCLEDYPGLTKREFFAAMALQGLLASGKPGYDAEGQAVEMADLLILALNEEVKK